MATLQEVEVEIKAIAATINELKVSGAAKADPQSLKKHVVGGTERRKGEII